MNAEQLVFSRRHAVTLVKGPPMGDGQAVARQLDAVLMSIGFKCSEPLLTALSNLHPDYVIDVAVRVLGFARQEVGADKQHNVYFIDFPANVPDTMEFWMGLLVEGVRQAAAGGDTRVRGAVTTTGFIVDLLSLPGYGAYQHTYQEMLARHAEFEPLLADRMTILHLGRDIETEARALFAELTGSAVPLNETDLAAVRFLAPAYSTPFAVAAIPVRETRAVVNAERLRTGLPMVATTVTDVLRAAAELSGSDVTLAKPPKFASLSRRIRRELMAALELAASERSLPDMLRHPEAWKRLAERLHPHEFGQFPLAQRAFEVARGETDVQSRAGQAEAAFAAGLAGKAARAMSPGEFYRSLDRLLREAGGVGGQKLAVVRQAEHLAPEVSGRVLLSVREHLVNRVRTGGPRVFAGRRGRAWVTADRRSLLDEGVVRDVNGIIDAALVERLPQGGTFVFDPAILGAALPLSGRAQAEGLGSWPRGSVSKLEPGDELRLYAYWRENKDRTDYDLSCLFAGPGGGHGWLSYTNLRNPFGEHSGDITSAPHGASEFVNIHLPQVPHGVFIIPQLYVFSGEGFDQVAENFVGYMTRDSAQRGLPFEAATVRMKTVLRGEDKVAMPVVFFRGDDGAWYAKWLNLGLRGATALWGGHRVEENRVSTQLLVEGIMARQYLTLRYLADALKARNTVALMRDGWQDWLAERPAGPVTYIGIERPEKLPEDAEVFTLGQLGGLVPA